MPRIILIETSTALCSVALTGDGGVTGCKVSPDQRSQASLTAPFVKELLDGEGLKVSDCDAVCVSMGPGSYTGLRVGVSTAKGLCFAAGLPLIAVCTLDILARQAIEGGMLPPDCKTIIPMIDARRMEVYTALYSPDGVRKDEIRPLVVEPDSFDGVLAEGPALFIGDGALKCRSVLDRPDAYFVEAFPRADAMLAPALKAYDEKRFENTAYFEPLYLKQFVATVSKKSCW